MSYSYIRKGTVLYHGTRDRVLSSIHEHGLLERNRIEEKGHKVNHAPWTRNGSIYFSTTLDHARRWGSHSGSITIVLAIILEEDDLDKVIVDRNFFSEWPSFGVNVPVEFQAETIPSTRIFVVMDDETRIPLAEYLAQVA